MKNIGIRLETIYDLIPFGSKVCDVGADHGLLGRKLLESGKADLVQLVENKSGPFGALQRNLIEYVDDVRLLLSLSDGIDELDPRIDTLVISGLGGDTIVNIIDCHFKKLLPIERIIIGAHTKPFIVRELLFSVGYKIENEVVIKEANKLYLLISFVKGRIWPILENIVYGTLKTSSDPLVREYLKKNELALKREMKAR